MRQGIIALHDFPTNKRVKTIALKRKLSKFQQLKDAALPEKIAFKDRPVDEYAWRVNPFRHDKWIPIKNGTMEFTGVDFLIAAYLGMYHGLIK